MTEQANLYQAFNDALAGHEDLTSNDTPVDRQSFQRSLEETRSAGDAYVNVHLKTPERQVELATVIGGLVSIYEVAAEVTTVPPLTKTMKTKYARTAEILLTLVTPTTTPTVASVPTTKSKR